MGNGPRPNRYGVIRSTRGKNGPMEPTTGQVVTVFRSHLHPEGAAAYYAHAAEMGELASSMPGYVEHKVFVAEDGERLTLVTFADRASHDAWRDHPQHREAQRAGIREYYDHFSIAVATVEDRKS